MQRNTARRFISWLCILGLTASISVMGQKSYTLEITTLNSKEEFKKTDYLNKFSDSLSLNLELTKIIQKLQIRGYAESQYDSIIYNDKKVTAFLATGSRYRWKKIKTDNIQWQSFGNINYKLSDFDDQYFNYKKQEKLFAEITTDLENTGYPFAQVFLTDIVIDSNTIEAQLNIDKGALIIIDTLIMSDLNMVNTNYMELYLGIRSKDVYNELKIEKMDKKMMRIEFADLSKPSEVLIKDNRATIKLHLKPKNANQFDGIIGFQPNANNDGKLQFTGNLRLDLKNVLKHGEKLKLNWESYGNQSQSLIAQGSYPFILNTYVGVSYDFALDKRDSSFLNIAHKPSINYSLEGANYIGVYAQFLNTNTLGSSASINASSSILDIKTRGLGISLNINELDYPFNPRRGFLIQISADMGNKKVVKRADVDSSVYIGNGGSTKRYAGVSYMAWYIPTLKRQSFLVSNRTAWIDSKQTLTNELFRIGGSNSLRGFDEKSVLANFYTLMSFEYHFFIDQNSYFGLFYDISHIDNKLNEKQTSPYQGFGASISFSTVAGIFKLSYALGKSPNQNIQFKNSKIHFGYSALF